MTDWERSLARWSKAGLIDDAAAQKIRAFEESQSGPSGFRWPTIIALVFGGSMLAAGVLLFVAAHWDTLSPSLRFTLVVAMVAIFHLGGSAATKRTQALATTLHGVGTVSLGAAIYLSGQIFNMNEHWPTAILLWAAGAAIGWWLLGDWVQFALAAMLTPFWLAGEWAEMFPRMGGDAFRVLTEGLLLIWLTYLSARGRDLDGANRRVLVWIGGIAVLPGAMILALESQFWRTVATPSPGPIAIGFLIAFGLPLAGAFLLRGRDAWMNGVAAAWVAILGWIATTDNIGDYLWCALGAAGMVAWGVRDGRSERVNLGMIGFAVTLLFFYFSQVMDKLGRSASLIGLGLLFLAGGWALERMRRRLVARAREAA